MFVEPAVNHCWRRRNWITPNINQTMPDGKEVANVQGISALLKRLFAIALASDCFDELLWLCRACLPLISRAKAMSPSNCASKWEFMDPGATWTWDNGMEKRNLISASLIPGRSLRTQMFSISVPLSVANLPRLSSSCTKLFRLEAGASSIFIAWNQKALHAARKSEHECNHRSQWFARNFNGTAVFTVECVAKTKETLTQFRGKDLELLRDWWKTMWTGTKAEIFRTYLPEATSEHWEALSGKWKNHTSSPFVDSTLLDASIFSEHLRTTVASAQFSYHSKLILCCS